MARLIKSLVYLASFTTVGYVLMKLTEPTPDQLKHIHGNKYKDPETRKKTELILQKLKEASERKDPIYIAKNKEESTNQSQENSQKQPTKREII